MSIQSQIDRISGAVQDAFAALTEKGVTVPDDTNVTGLADLIAAIESGGGVEVITVVPASNDNIIITPSKDGTKVKAGCMWRTDIPADSLTRATTSPVMGAFIVGAPNESYWGNVKQTVVGVTGYYSSGVKLSAGVVINYSQNHVLSSYPFAMISDRTVLLFGDATYGVEIGGEYTIVLVYED